MQRHSSLGPQAVKHVVKVFGAEEIRGLNLRCVKTTQASIITNCGQGKLFSPSEAELGAMVTMRYN